MSVVLEYSCLLMPGLIFMVIVFVSDHMINHEMDKIVENAEQES